MALHFGKWFASHAINNAHQGHFSQLLYSLASYAAQENESFWEKYEIIKALQWKD